jgi:anti-anti-sigma factor
MKGAIIMSDAVTKIVPHDTLLVVRVLKSTLDDASTNQLLEDVYAAAPDKPRAPIVIDLTDVKFAPSVALGSLVQLTNSFKFEERRFILIGVSDRIMGPIRVTRLDRVLEIRDSLDDIS